MSAIVSALAALARCWVNEHGSTCIDPSADAARELSQLSKREYDKLRADLSAAKAGGADLVAQRDTALGLCKQREQELATVTAERAKDRERDTATMQTLLEIASADLDAERAAHSETRKALELQTELRNIALRGEQTARAELEKSRAREKAFDDLVGDLQPPDILVHWLNDRAELATALAENMRLQALFQQVHGCHHSWVTRGDSAEKDLAAERAAHAETRKALEEWTQNGFGARTPAEVQVFIEEGCRVEREIAEHARAELATAQAENERLQGLFQQTHGCHHSWVARGDRLERELATALEQVKAATSRLVTDIGKCEHCGERAPLMQGAKLPSHKLQSVCVYGWGCSAGEVLRNG